MKRIILLIFFLFSAIISYGQEENFSDHSIKVGAGIGFIEGYRESGLGTLLSFGYQKSLWKNRLRISPAITMGRFSSTFVMHTRDQYFSTTALGVQASLDVIKYRSLSLFAEAGSFGSRSSGLLGTGGEFGHSSSVYFRKYYVGGTAALGLRIEPKNSRIAYEISPVNVSVGSDYFVMGFAKVGMDIKIR